MAKAMFQNLAESLPKREEVIITAKRVGLHLEWDVQEACMGVAKPLAI